MKQHFSSIVFGLAILGAAALLGNAIMNRNKSAGNISVTGLGKKDFTSDLIVWDGMFSKENYDLKQAYNDLAIDRKEVENYLKAKGVEGEKLVFSAVSTRRNTRAIYQDGEYRGEEFVGYVLEQRVQITSKEVDKIEKISREITELLNRGVQFYSEPPRYYYTKIEDLKIEMVSQATENARLRAEKIAANSGSKLGKLKVADMGIFQITGQNSNEDYSWGGVFNTASRDKTASITMQLEYEVR